MNGNKNSALLTLANAQSGASTITGTGVNIQWLDNLGFEFVWTGTLTGTLEIDVSNDNSNWVLFAPDLSITNPAGSASSSVTLIKNCPFAWVRFKYTASSGTGNLTVTLCAKSI